MAVATVARTPTAQDRADSAHLAIIAAVAEGDAMRTVAFQDAHRKRALERLRASLGA